MASALTADDFAAVETHLRKEYFLVRTQTLVVAGMLIGVTSGVTAWTAAKAAVASEAGKLATDEITRLKGVATTEVAAIEGKRKEATTIVAGLAPEVTDIKGKIWSISERMQALDVLAATYWFVNGSKLDGVPYGRIGSEEDGSYFVAFNNEGKGFDKGKGHRSPAYLQKDGTLLVPKFLRVGMAVNDKDAVVECVGTRVGKHILWNYGEHWAY